MDSVGSDGASRLVSGNRRKFIFIIFVFYFYHFCSSNYFFHHHVRLLIYFFYFVVKDNLCAQLWHACSGSVYIPKVGEKVFYFPQGHAEQVPSSLQFFFFYILNFIFIVKQIC